MIPIPFVAPYQMLPFFALLTLACTLANALYLPNVDGESSKIKSSSKSSTKAKGLALSFDVSKREHHASEYWPNIISGVEKRHVSKRDTSASLTNYQDVIYHVDLTLGGTQKVTVSLDTGSSDLWVWGTQQQGYEGGSYSPRTGNDTGEMFQILYLDQSGSSGRYFTDAIGFGALAELVEDFQFAVVNVSNSGGFGVLGIADKNQEASKSPYDNLPWALKKQGVIQNAAYSLFLEDKKGKVIFDGKDESKYTGELQSYPVASDTGLSIELQKMELGNETLTINAPVLLDSGTTAGILPADAMKTLDRIFKPKIVTPTNGISERYVDCNQPNDKYISFDFGKNKIKASYADVTLKFSDGSCMLGFTSYGNNYILGDAFLRNAYVYYDLDHKQISIAQAKKSFFGTLTEPKSDDISGNGNGNGDGNGIFGYGGLNSKVEGTKPRVHVS